MQLDQQDSWILVGPANARSLTLASPLTVT
jgi:hypothetical protein